MFHKVIGCIPETSECCISFLSQNVGVLQHLLGTKLVLNDAAVFSKSRSTPLVRQNLPPPHPKIHPREGG